MFGFLEKPFHHVLDSFHFAHVEGGYSSISYWCSFTCRQSVAVNTAAHKFFMCSCVDCESASAAGQICRWHKSLEWVVACWCCMMLLFFSFLMPVALFRAKKYTLTCRKHINAAAVWQVDQLRHHIADCRYLRWVGYYRVCSCTEKLISKFLNTFTSFSF